MTIDEALRLPTISVPEAGKLFFGLGRDASYRAAAEGDIETVRIGGSVRVPVAPLAARLGLKAQIGASV